MRAVPPLVLAVVAGCSQDVVIGEKQNRPPVVSISDPQDGSVFAEVDQIDFVGVVADADGLSDLATLTWASDQVAEPLATLLDAPPDASGYTQIARMLPPGTHAISLTVVDRGGAQAVASIAVVVEPQDVLPTAEISVPAPGATFDPGEEIALVGSAFDPNQTPDTLDATWSFSTGGGPRADIQSAAPSGSGSIQASWTDAPVGEHQLFLTVTDSDGNAGEASVVVIVRDPYADDVDQDGFTVLAGDCDDTDPERNPGLDERCDAKDNDCNTVVDDKDLDFDGHVDQQCYGYVGLLPVDDCDDAVGTVFPGAAEQDDGLDNDCNGAVDDGLSEWDNDGDCFCTAASCTGSANAACTTVSPGDCDDTDAELHDRDDDLDGASPCDGDCDDLDPGLNTADADLDGFSTCRADCDDTTAALNPADGDADGASSCAGDCDDGNALLNVLDADADGASSCAGDCNDGSAALNLDDVDLDGFTTCDDDCDDSDPLMLPTDGDSDGASSCQGDCDDANPALNLDDLDLDGFSSCGGDCADGDAMLNPADIDLDGTSSCAGDCDDVSAVLNVDDADGDGASTCAGDCDDASVALNLSDADADGFSTCAGDCDDTSVVLNPADADLDGWSTCELDCDDADPLVDPADLDGDGLSTCELDCDDANNLVFPGAVEVPYNYLDDDCVGGDLDDVDGDNFRSTLVGGHDCDDANAAVYPGATEVCNGIDDDCDPLVDENGAVGCEPYYLDSDGDGFGTGTSRCQCGPKATTGYTSLTNDDCYDGNVDAFPGQTVSYYDDRGDSSWDYDCDGVEEKDDNRTRLHSCYWSIGIPSICYYSNGWTTSAPGCGDTADWGTSCQFSLYASGLCEPATLETVDQNCQ